VALHNRGQGEGVLGQSNAAKTNQSRLNGNAPDRSDAVDLINHSDSKGAPLGFADPTRPQGNYHRPTKKKKAGTKPAFSVSCSD
jgi:hypothetical protein